MTSIDGAYHLAAAIRRQVASLRQVSVSKRSAADKTRTSAERPAPGEATHDMAAVVSHRIKAIDRNDPDRRVKAMRAFLEGTLLAELGDSLASDPAFDQLVDEVQRQMEEDSQLRSLMAKATEEMLRDP